MSRQAKVSTTCPHLPVTGGRGSRSPCLRRMCVGRGLVHAQERGDPENTQTGLSSGGGPGRVGGARFPPRVGPDVALSPYASVVTTMGFSQDSSPTPHGVSGCVRKLPHPHPDVRCPLGLGGGLSGHVPHAHLVIPPQGLGLAARLADL